MSYTRKTRDEFEVQGNYGHRWEVLTIDETLEESEAILKDYRDNEPSFPHRIVKKRVKIVTRS
jgi:hypothetical protein